MNSLPVIHTEDEWEQALADGAGVLCGEGMWEMVLENIYRADDAKVRAHKAQVRQARIKHASDMTTMMWHPALGVPEHRTDIETFHAWAWRFRDQYDRPDYSCWNDKQFVKEWIRDNESGRVNVEKPGNKVGWTPEVENKPKSTGRLVLTDNRGNAQ